MTTRFFPQNQLPVEVKGQDVAIVTEATEQEDVNQEELAQVRNFMNTDSNKETDIRKVSDHLVNKTIKKVVGRYKDDEMNERYNLQGTKSADEEGNMEDNEQENNQEVELGEQTMLKIAINVEDVNGNAEIGTSSGDELCLREVTVIVHNDGKKQENNTDLQPKHHPVANTDLQPKHHPVDNTDLQPKHHQVDDKSVNSVNKKWPFLTVILPEYTYELLPKVKFLSGFIPVSTNMIYSLCPIGDGGAWVSYYYSRTVNLVDNQGSVHQVVSHSTAINDISVAPRTQDILTSAQGQYPWISPQGQSFLTLPEAPQPLTPADEEEFWTSTKKNRYSWNLPNTTHEQHLWMCSGEDLGIWECCTCTSIEKPVLRFKTESSPMSLCATMDGHIIVGMDQILTKFTKEGKPLFSTMDFQVGTRPLVYSPSKITECPVTQNIAVLDRNWSTGEQQYKSFVLVMDLEFQEVLRYKGQGVTPNLKLSFRRGQQRFDPVDIKYDSIGNLVIGDRQGHSLHLFLINGEGQLTNVLHTDKLPTQAIGIDRKNVLWAAFGDFNNMHIKILQYSK